MNRRVVITGIGWITPLGHDIETAWGNILAGSSGVAPTTIFDAKTFPTTFSAEVKDFDLKKFLNDDEFEDHRNVSRQAGFALAAAKMAWKNSGLESLTDLDKTMVGIYLGGGEGPLDFTSFAQAAIDGWDYEGNDLDSTSWAEVAAKVLSPVKELEQDPNMRDHNIACLPVVNDGLLVGIVTEHDLLNIAGDLIKDNLRQARGS